MIKVSPAEFARDIRKRAGNLSNGIDHAVRRAAHRGRAHMVTRTPVDTGQMKNGWRVTQQSDLVNDAPHAGIVESGARPHKVSKEGREAIARWAMRQLGVSAEEAESVSWGIVKKIEKEGQKGLYITRDALPDLRKYVGDEVLRAIRAQANRRMP